MHYYKFNIGSWAKDTSHLTLTEEAAYLRLVNFYYDHEKPIPLKTHLVLRKLRMADQSETVEMILDEFFEKTKDGWIHKHCDKLIAEYQKMAERNKKNAKFGGRPKINDLDKPSGNHGECDNNPSRIPNQELETINQEPETNNKNKTSNRNSHSLDYSSWPSMPSDNLFDEWRALRKRLRANVTQTVVNKTGKELTKAASLGFTVDQCFEQWIYKGWRGFEAEWMRGSCTAKQSKHDLSNIEYTSGSF